MVEDNGIPFNELGQTSVNIHITQSIFTPKIGYRILDAEHFKIDALAGIRYWYLSESLAVEPSGVNRSRSANWVDGLGGARITVPLSEKASIMIAGDAGAGGANLDYQVVGLFNMKFTQHLGLGLGWRYLDIDYQGKDQFLYDSIINGPLAGFYYTFGGKPPVPVAATCSVSPTEIWSGDPVTANITAQNFNPKHTLTYNWTSTGAKISGTGTTSQRRYHGPRARQLLRHRNSDRRQREEEQRSQLHLVVHREAAAAAAGKLFGQSWHHCHQSVIHHHHDGHRSAGLALDVQLDEHWRSVERQRYLRYRDCNQR